MGINDPYDRSGQYSNGDRGSPLGNYGGLANDNPDRRDVAVGTMMGEGGPRENAAGYGAVLDSIEGRISAAQAGADYGQAKGKSSAGIRSNDTTLENMVKARDGLEYNAWSEKYGGPSYGQATRGAANAPKPDEQRMYDQAMQVYDDYYDKGTYRGIAQGGTFYQQNAHVAGKKAGQWQRDLQNKYGAVPVGIAGHVMTGPGLYGPGSKTGRSGPGYERVSPSITGSFGGNFAPGAYSDTLEAPEVESFTGSTGVNEFGNFPSGQIRGGTGTAGLKGGTPGDDRLFDDVIPSITSPTMLGQPAAARAINVNMPGATVQQIQNRVAQPARPAPAAAPAPQPARPQIGPRESYWTPGPVARAKGSNATGMETRRTQDGVIHDNKGAYGGHDAFGPNDPFGGLGYDTRGYADVVDSFDRDMGMTRSVYDKQGRLVDRGFWSGGGAGDVEARGHDDSGNATVGDGSYADQSGRNDNNPQGII